MLNNGNNANILSLIQNILPLLSGNGSNNNILKSLFHNNKKSASDDVDTIIQNEENDFDIDTLIKIDDT